jgi:hypothetical protein
MYPECSSNRHADGDGLEEIQEIGDNDAMPFEMLLSILEH